MHKMSFLDYMALQKAFSIIEIDPNKLDKEILKVITDYFMEKFKIQGYIRALEEIRKDKEELNANVEQLIVVAD